MTIRPVYLVTIAAISFLSAAENGIELSGVMTAGGKTRVALTDTEKKVTTWVEPGEEFNGYTVDRYDPSEEAVFLRKDGEETRIGLVAAKTPDTPAPASTAQPTAPKNQATAAAIRSNLRQLATAARQYQLAHGVSTASYADLVGPGKMIKELKPVAGENYSTLSFGPNVTGVNVTTADGMTVALDLSSAAASMVEPPATASPASPTASGTVAGAPTNVNIEVLPPTGRQPASPNYTIRGGDTWESISQATGVPVPQLRQLNPSILDGGPLPAGQTIRIR